MYQIQITNAVDRASSIEIGTETDNAVAPHCGIAFARSGFYDLEIEVVYST